MPHSLWYHRLRESHSPKTLKLGKINSLMRLGFEFRRSFQKCPVKQSRAKAYLLQTEKREGRGSNVTLIILLFQADVLV